MMMKFRKKPVVIEATQWFKDGDHPVVVMRESHTTANHIARVALGWVTLVGASPIIAGTILLAWRWLP